MVKFEFFVHCSGWKDGGYKNTHFAETKQGAVDRVKRWNDEREQYAAQHECPMDSYVELLSVTEITDAEFAEDFIC